MAGIPIVLNEIRFVTSAEVDTNDIELNESPRDFSAKGFQRPIFFSDR